MEIESRPNEVEDIESQTFQNYKTDELGFNPRLGFVRKVYGILSVQLLFTAIMVYFAQGPLRGFYYTDSGDIRPIAASLFTLAAVGSIITSIMVVCYSSLAKTVPTNYILLSIFTACEAYVVSMFTTFFDAEDVILAAFLTFALTATLTLYAFTTKKDFTVYGGLLWILGWGLFMITALMALFGFGTFQSFGAGGLIISVIVICFYGVYLIYDTQLIMGGHRFELSLDDYIVAALVIYIDIIVLFIRILRVIAALKQH